MEQEAIENLIGEYGWMAAVAFVFLIGRNTIESLIEAIKVFAGDDFNPPSDASYKNLVWKNLPVPDILFHVDTPSIVSRDNTNS